MCRGDIYIVSMRLCVHTHMLVCHCLTYILLTHIHMYTHILLTHILLCIVCRHKHIHATYIYYDIHIYKLTHTYYCVRRLCAQGLFWPSRECVSVFVCVCACLCLCLRLCLCVPDPAVCVCVWTCSGARVMTEWYRNDAQ